MQKIFVLKIYLLLVVSLMSFSSWGQGKCFQMLFTTENDFLGIANKDEHYTGSAKLELLIPEQVKWLPFIKYVGENSLTIQRIGIGGTAYTPQDLLSPEHVVGDRPYASLVFVNLGNTSISTSNGDIFLSDITIGAMGTSLPGNAQSQIHKDRWFGNDRPIPLGWHNQIGYNGNQYYLKYAFYGRSQEFKGGKDFHYWGGISLGYSPPSWHR